MKKNKRWNIRWEKPNYESWKNRKSKKSEKILQNEIKKLINGEISGRIRVTDDRKMSFSSLKKHFLGICILNGKTCI